ncbi:MAG: hypothetical protein A3H93_03240 [Rhodocyclales bacterium RIFCSPLOWO2_02_FULL_63_24]|nr:MAG: hypothetical protein A2040_18575 [Rhodocyclales bacterium GWA2_65_19]OHC67995.1 MAG: hypothetical protein A3H93_03240 [Rhodocyclales bacterium RIFCSPLOWO2_02_FULL_63_24]
MRKLALFRRVFLASRWLRERLTPAGLALAGLAAFAAAFGLDTQSNLAHGLFAIGASLLAVDAASAAWLRRRTPALVARRQLPAFVTAGEATRYRLELRNMGARRLRPARLVERLHQPWPLAAELAAATASGQGFDRRVGYPAFMELLRRLRAVDVDAVDLPPLLPGQGRELDIAAHPVARGVAQFETLFLAQSGPLGLVELRVAVKVETASLAVLPARRAVELPPAGSQRHLQPGGISLAQHVGDAEEFRSLRDYRPGDPLRAIHWRSFARTGRPVVREYQEEFFSRHALVLDTVVPAGAAAAFETAVSIAAWLVAQPRDADSLLDLMFVGDRVHRLTAGRGLGGADGLLRVLAGVAPTPAASIAPLLASLERHSAQVASVVALFLSWDEPRRQAVRRLMARGLRPTVLLVGAVNTVDAADAAEFAGILRHVAPTEGAP